MITYHAKLVAKQLDCLGYTTFVFQNLDKSEYIMCVMFPNWEQSYINLDDEGYVTVKYVEETLKDDYTKLFSLLLTDRGTEFEKCELFEVNIETGEIRGNIFYCDPQSPSQKPHVENNHNYVRDILPNSKSLKNLTQEDLNLMFSHINSTPRASLNGKTPYEAFEFLYGNEILNKLNIQKIEKDMVTLQPYLLKIK